MRNRVVADMQKTYFRVVSGEPPDPAAEVRYILAANQLAAFGIMTEYWDTEAAAAARWNRLSGYYTPIVCACAGEGIWIEVYGVCDHWTAPEAGAEPKLLVPWDDAGYSCGCDPLLSADHPTRIVD